LSRTKDDGLLSSFAHLLDSNCSDSEAIIGLRCRGDNLEAREITRGAFDDQMREDWSTISCCKDEEPYGPDDECTGGAEIKVESALEPEAQGADKIVTDNPVNMYFHDIGRVSLLTAHEEKILASRIEDAQRLADIEALYRHYHGAQSPTVYVTILLIRHLLAAKPTVDALAQQFKFPVRDSIIQTIQEPKLRAAVDGVIDQKIVEAIAKSTEKSTPEVEKRLIDLSIESRLLPRAAVLIDGEEASWEQMSSLISDPIHQEYLRRLDAINQRLKAHFENIKRLAKKSKRHLIEANLRLVVSVAKKYVRQGMPLPDLIQEGNVGLLHAVDRFDHRRGYKFSTYATWWIRQAITRGIADQGRTIRIPVHMVETIDKILRVKLRLTQEYGHEPSSEEIGEYMGIPSKRVREVTRWAQLPISLENPVGEESNSNLGDLIEDQSTLSPADVASHELLKAELNEILCKLTEKEKKMIQLRFGLIDGTPRTLEGAGREFNVTRERARQIEGRALAKLRHPSLSRKLKDYLE
jgi:RNA polymerase sigma factor (sigma-70 family)